MELGLEEVLAEIARGEAGVLSALGELDRAAASASEALALHAAVGTLDHSINRYRCLLPSSR